MKGRHFITDEQLNQLKELEVYLAGLRDLIKTDVIDGGLHIRRDGLALLIQAAFQRAEDLYCDALESARSDEKGGAQ